MEGIKQLTANRMRSDRWGFSGKIVERELFGAISQEGRMETEAMLSRGEYLGHRRSLDFARTAQQFDPTDPAPRFANDLHATVAERLGFEDYARLKFYSAVGSMFDVKHGVDGFFEVQLDPEDPKSRCTVTMDITTNPNKQEYKANIIIQVPGDGLDAKEDKELWAAKIEEVADQVVALLKPQLERA